MTAESSQGPVTAAMLAKAVVFARGEEGVLFHGPAPDSCCFVPTSCIYFTPDGRLGFNEITYVGSGWAVRNQRFGHREEGGNFMFPDAGRLVTDLMQPEVRRFLQRLA